MKNYLLIGIIILISLFGIWWLAANSDEHDSASDNGQAADTSQPEAYDASADRADKVTFTSQYNPNFSFMYPGDWNLTEGTDNSAQQQLVTFESPMDRNGFYFCLDLTEVGADSDLDLSANDASLLAVDDFSAANVGKPLASVIFTHEGSPSLLWSVVDTKPQLTDTSFTSQITNPQARRLQSLGRFNCREEQAPELSLHQVTGSRWFAEAQGIMHSLSY